ncbi:MAG TPA: hypothetical protein VLC09_07170 [Polyangiaceae bacterium]|nr:hypothetical protein [Polyangiaceae bacterium]
MSDRFARQRILEEVGDAGQARLEQAVLRLGQVDPIAARAARAYGLGLGFADVQHDDSLGQPSFVHAEHFRHLAPRGWAQGAHLALGRAREVLGLDRGGVR